MQKRLGIILTLLLLAMAATLAGVNQMDVQLEIPRLISPSPSVPVRLTLYQLIFALLTAGFGAGLLIGWGSCKKYLRLLQKLQRQNRQLEEELRNLRNLPLEQDIHL